MTDCSISERRCKERQPNQPGSWCATCVETEIQELHDVINEMKKTTDELCQMVEGTNQQLSDAMEQVRELTGWYVRQMG